MRPKWDQRRVHCIVHDSLDVVEIDISDEALPNSSQLVQAMLAEICQIRHIATQIYPLIG